MSEAEKTLRAGLAEVGLLDAYLKKAASLGVGLVECLRQCVVFPDVAVKTEMTQIDLSSNLWPYTDTETRGKQLILVDMVKKDTPAPASEEAISNAKAMFALEDKYADFD